MEIPLADLTLSGEYTNSGVLSDGNYLLTIDGSKIASVEGGGFDSDGDGMINDLLSFGDVVEDRFFALAGDSDGDGIVGLTDYFGFRAIYNQTLSSDHALKFFDFDDNGHVGLTNYFSFRSFYGGIR